LRLLAGETQQGVIADLDARGIRTVRGGTWSRAGLRMALTRPRNAGIVTYRGTVVAKLPGEPILSEDEHAQLVSLYAARRPGRPPSGAYLCSGAVACAACGKPMAGRPRRDRHYPDGEIRREYVCNPTGGYDGCGKTAIDQRALDEHAKELAIAALSDAETAHAAQVAAAEAQEEAGELDEQVAKAEKVRNALADRLGRGELELDEWEAAKAPLDKRIAALREKREALGAGTARAVPADSAAAWRKRWKAASPADRRDMLRLALRGRHLVVTPAGRSRAPVAQRVTVSG
jgi:site-specific DNA recombinase